MFKTSPALTEKNIRLAENVCMKNFNNKYQLMEKAGLEAFKHLQNLYPNAKSIAVICGHGNNAGDGMVVAKFAKTANLDVQVFLLSSNPLSESASTAKQNCEKSNIIFGDVDNVKLNEFDLIVDAMLGIGVKGEVREPFAHGPYLPIRGLNLLAPSRMAK